MFCYERSKLSLCFTSSSNKRASSTESKKCRFFQSVCTLVESAFAVGNRSDTVNSIVYLEFLLVIGLLGFKVLIFLERMRRLNYTYRGKDNMPEVVSSQTLSLS